MIALCGRHSHCMGIWGSTGVRGELYIFHLPIDSPVLTDYPLLGLLGRYLGIRADEWG